MINVYIEPMIYETLLKEEKNLKYKDKTNSSTKNKKHSKETFIR